MGLVACGALLAASAPAAAAAPTPGGDYISYVGDVSVKFTSGGDSLTHRFTGATLTYVCADGACAITLTGGTAVKKDGSLQALEDSMNGSDPASHIVLDAGGAFTIHIPGSGGSVCADNYESPITVGGTLTATTANTYLASKEEAANCGDGSSSGIAGVLVTFTGTVSGGDPCVLTAIGCPLVVFSPTSSPTATTQTVAPVATPAPAAIPSTASASRIANGDPAAPSVLSALVTVQDSPITPLGLCLAALLTVVLSLAVALPKKLYSAAISASPKRWTDFTTTLAKREDRMSRRLSRAVAPRGEAATPDAEMAEIDEPEHRFGSGPWRKAALGVIAAAVISAFVDPGIGLNWGSVRLATSISASFLLNVVVGWSVALWLARRIEHGVKGTYSFKAWSLAIVVATVIFTRITGMEPGMVFGLVAGLALGHMAAKAADAKVAVIQTGYAFAVGLVGWLTFSAVSPSLGGSGNVFVELLLDTLSGLAVAGFSAAPLALLPIAGMGGAKVYDWSRLAWFAMYVVGLLGFLVVLLPQPYSWSGVDMPLKAWVGLYVAYTAVALALYLVLVRPWERSADGEAEGVEGDA